MKKLIQCILMLGMITGCTKQDIQEEPPAVVNPSEEIEYINKIDQSKDWVYTLETTEVEIPEYAVEVLKDMEYTNGTDFENWYSEVYTTKIELNKFVINIDTPEWKEINNQIADAYEDKKIKPLPLGLQYLSYRFFVSDDILSVVIKEGSFLPGSDQKSQSKILNVDLHSGEIIDNEHLLDYFQLSLDGYQNILSKYNNGRKKCETELIDGCYFQNDNFEWELLFVDSNQLYKIDISYKNDTRIRKVILIK